MKKLNNKIKKIIIYSPRPQRFYFGFLFFFILVISSNLFLTFLLSIKLLYLFFLFVFFLLWFVALIALLYWGLLKGVSNWVKIKVGFSYLKNCYFFSAFLALVIERITALICDSDAFLPIWANIALIMFLVIGGFSRICFSKNLSGYKKANKTAYYAKEKRYTYNYTNSCACWNHLWKSPKIKNYLYLNIVA